MVALLIYLVPGGGAQGAAISVLLGACSMFVWVVYQTFRVSKLTTRRMVSFWSADLVGFMRLVRQAPVETL